jgi:hypothetical protein
MSRPDGYPDHTVVGPPPVDYSPSAPRPVRLPIWIAVLALLVGAVGVGLSVWALVTSSAKQPAPSFAGDSKTRVCAAFETTAKAVLSQTNAKLGPEPVQQAVVAANARLSLLGGGDYLLRQIDSATPGDLAAAVTAFANDIQALGINYLAGAVSTDPAQAELTKRADAAMTAITDLCR